MPSTTAKLQSMIAGLQSKGLTIREIASRAHISPATIHRGATGECRSPSFDTFARVEKAWTDAGRPAAK